jgi:hypothetical protein
MNYFIWFKVLYGRKVRNVQVHVTTTYAEFLSICKNEFRLPQAEFFDIGGFTKDYLLIEEVDETKTFKKVKFKPDDTFEYFRKEAGEYRLIKKC